MFFRALLPRDIPRFDGVYREKKHRSHASRIPSSNQSPSYHSEERKTPLSLCPASKTCTDMGLRTVFTVQMPKQKRPFSAIFRSGDLE
ncbi:hypothetical protein TNCV_3353331 [Trichonephila clavipes]|nr:hypothetical protein TNCV_3353331 [Trichonephila clavipes]